MFKIMEPNLKRKKGNGGRLRNFTTFIQRRDLHARQLDDRRYVCVYKGFTAGLMYLHLIKRRYNPGNISTERSVHVLTYKCVQTNQSCEGEKGIPDVSPLFGVRVLNPRDIAPFILYYGDYVLKLNCIWYIEDCEIVGSMGFSVVDARILG
jgi:hypothetical protein